MKLLAPEEGLWSPRILHPLKNNQAEVAADSFKKSRREIWNVLVILFSVMGELYFEMGV